MNIKPIVLLFFIGFDLPRALFAQQQNTVPRLQPDEVIAFHFTDEQVNFWLAAEDYIMERMKSGIDIYSGDFYKDAAEREKMWLDSIDSGDSPYNTDYRSRYWGSNWSYASGLIAEQSDTLAYNFNLLTAWHSPASSNGRKKNHTGLTMNLVISSARTLTFFWIAKKTLTGITRAIGITIINKP